jgi:hypothetical protein
LGKLNQKEIGVDDLVLMLNLAVLVRLDDELFKIFKIRNTSFEKLK